MHPKDHPGRGKPVRGNRDRNYPFHLPFRDLAALVRQRGVSLSSKPGGGRRRRFQDEDLLFAAEMQEVQPLPREGAFAVPLTPDPAPGSAPGNEDDEALACLTDLVAGKGKFELEFTDEYVEGRVAGLNPRLLAALKAGALPLQDWCDLHGLTTAEARVHLEDFLERSARRGLRCVLVVHGRGRGSPGHLPVLKQNLNLWLAAKRFRRQVLAFVTAQPYDGGGGALYLLLRRPAA